MTGTNLCQTIPVTSFGLAFGANLVVILMTSDCRGDLSPEVISKDTCDRAEFGLHTSLLTQIRHNESSRYAVSELISHDN